MVENISLSVSIQYTPNVSFSINDQSDNLSNSVLNGTNNEPTSITDTCTSGDSLIFYTPDASLTPDVEFVPSPTIISDIFTNFQPLSTHNDPLFSRDATEFICNLNPPNSSFVIGASTTQSCKVSLFPIHYKDSLRSNKVTRVSVSPGKHKQVNLTKISAVISDNIDLDSSCTTMAYSSRKFCQTTQSNERKILPRKSESADESFYTPNTVLDPLNHKRKYRTNKLLRCNLCANTYKSKSRYENHQSRHHTGHNLWICEFCNISFHSRKLYRFHTVTTHINQTLRRSDRNKNTIARNTGVPDKVKHSLQKSNKLTPKRFNKTLNGSRLHLAEKKNLSFTVEDSFPRIQTNTTSTPLLSTEKSKRKYFRKGKRYAKTDSEGKPNKNVKQNLEQVLEPFRCDQCTKEWATLRALNIHKFIHKRLVIDSSTNDVTRPLTSKRKRRQMSARASPCKLCEFDCNLHVLQC